MLSQEYSNHVEGVVGWCDGAGRGVLLFWIIVGQGLTALAVDAGGGCLDIFSLVYHFSLLSPALWETARYRLKYCLKGPLSPKQPTNQPMNHVDVMFDVTSTVCQQRSECKTLESGEKLK